MFFQSGTSATQRILVSYRLLDMSQAQAPLPTRLRNLLALLAIFVGLIAQTVHTHPISGKTSDKGGFHSLGASGENSDLCPLCIAMHSAQPSTAVVPLTPEPLFSLLLIPEVEEATLFPPAFTHLSRPPPYSTR